MKRRFNYYKCKKCSHKIPTGQRRGGTSIVYQPDGEVRVSHHNSGCPLCGGELEHEYEIREIVAYNGSPGSTQ